MKYVRPELDYVRFENHDILTDSNDTPIMPISIGDGDEVESFDEP